MNSQNPIKHNTKNKDIRNKKRRAKSIVMLFLIFIIGTTLLCLSILGVISEKDKYEAEKGTSYLFYEPDYALNILESEEYLNLDRSIKFENPDSGITSVISYENLDAVPTDLKAPVVLLCDFINYAIEGDFELLNSLFSEEYIQAGGKTKIEFTMQQLYNIRITYVNSYSENIDGYTEYCYDFWLEYMIHKNNGTFRNDMESDCIRKEYVRVTDRGGILAIDVLAPYNTQPKEPSTENEKRMVVAFTTSALIVGVACFGGYAIIKKQSRFN